MTADATSTHDHIALAERWSAHNYHPLPVVLTHREGAWMTDLDGRRYLDFLARYSALNFGHRRPDLVAAAKAQLDRLTLTGRQVSDALAGRGVLCKECQAALRVSPPLVITPEEI